MEERVGVGKYIYFKGIFMELHRKDRPGLLTVTWNIFLLTSKVLDTAASVRLAHCWCDCLHQKCESLPLACTWF